MILYPEMGPTVLGSNDEQVQSIGGINGWWKLRFMQKKSPPCHFVHHKSHKGYPGLPRRETRDLSPEL
jgi:hypothetical protein